MVMVKGRKLRNRYTYYAGFVPWFLCCFIMLMFGGNADNRWSVLLIIAAFCIVLCYLCSLLTMFSWVQPRRGHLVVNNPGETIFIPWKEIRRLRADDGLDIQLKGSDEEVSALAYQSSLIGLLAGNPSARRAVARIERFMKESADLQAPGEVERFFPWWRHFAWLSGGWLLLAVVMPLLGRLGN